MSNPGNCSLSGGQSPKNPTASERQLFNLLLKEAFDAFPKFEDVKVEELDQPVDIARHANYTNEFFINRLVQMVMYPVTAAV